MNKPGLKRQIPTLLGIGVLIVSLIIGIFAVGIGPGYLTPRAAPETTPKKVKITNTKDTGFTVSFITDEATAGFLKYGTDPTSLKTQAGDDRDQLTGNVGQFTTHHITVRDLKPGTPYYFSLGTGSRREEYLNEGQPYTVTTSVKGGAPPAAKTVYGTVNTTAGTPAQGAMVYMKIEGVGEMSSLVKDSGSWAIPLSNARTLDGSAYATIQPTDAISLTVQGLTAESTATLNTTVEKAQPVDAITLTATAGVGGTQSELGTDAETGEPLTSLADATIEETTGDEVAETSSEEDLSEPADETTTEEEFPELALEDTESEVLDLTVEEEQVVTSSQPLILGEAPPNVVIEVEIHSDTEINTQVTSSSNGTFEIDLAEIAADKNLEPGEHTITISYTDPTTGQKVTTTKTFTVKSQGTLAQASTGTSGTFSSSAPFGSGNPFPMPSPSPTPTASASAVPRTKPVATESSLPKSGSTSTTFLLILIGVFFVGTGAWSYALVKNTSQK